jgi:CRISPR/Cas system CSM-associated protein Csm4 (group 5 of RAMP superfamily)
MTKKGTAGAFCETFENSGKPQVVKSLRLRKDPISLPRPPPVAAKSNQTKEKRKRKQAQKTSAHQLAG